MSVEDTVKHCIEKSLQEKCRYSIEEAEDNENTVILHAPLTFLTSDLTEELRKHLIFVDATSGSYKEGYSMMYFLHYLEPEEDTFMDALAEPVSTKDKYEIENKLEKAITESAKDVPYTGDPYRVINHVVTNIEEELGVEIQGEDDKPLREHSRVGIGEQMSRYTRSNLISDDELEEVEDRVLEEKTETGDRGE
ncbi:hypothetical protein [Natrinema altunense]|uniref:Uncharacterized protein n=1 Tax=Natrinema altunense (strain JCM 12890 / CGMCC 1.3731 / AJ2) TaxID=1227494 RepID=L9ZEM0_NATA2|nr:hypothetical protein [Natrinema altunense]ELY83623.1 hypothetical protein C485_17762 [Natrinema altunense JCM 12890]